MSQVPLNEYSPLGDDNDTLSQRRYEVLSPVKLDFNARVQLKSPSPESSTLDPATSSTRTATADTYRNIHTTSHTNYVNYDDFDDDDEILRPELDSLNMETPVHPTASAFQDTPSSASPQFAYNHSLRMKSLLNSTRARGDNRDLGSMIMPRNEQRDYPEVDREGKDERDNEGDNYSNNDNDNNRDNDRFNDQPRKYLQPELVDETEMTASSDVIEIESQEFKPNPDNYIAYEPSTRFQPNRNVKNLNLNLNGTSKPVSPLKSSLASPFKAPGSAKRVAFGDGSKELVEVRQISPEQSRSLSGETSEETSGEIYGDITKEITKEMADDMSDDMVGDTTALPEQDSPLSDEDDVYDYDVNEPASGTRRVINGSMASSFANRNTRQSSSTTKRSEPISMARTRPSHSTRTAGRSRPRTVSLQESKHEHQEMHIMNPWSLDEWNALQDHMVRLARKAPEELSIDDYVRGVKPLFRKTNNLELKARIRALLDKFDGRI